MNLIKWLSIVLSISIGANLWFLYNGYHKKHLLLATQKMNVSGYDALAANREATLDDHIDSWSPYSSSTQIQLQPSTDVYNDERTSNPSSRASSNAQPYRSQEEHFNWLKSLAKTKEFQQLEFEVSSYLRLYPQDVNAMLLEAEAYYHNKPLNVALVHYYQLLSQALSPEQQNEIEKLIAVNTTRVIQQFSGDGAWNLLAQFLEPLVQIAPRDRQYLMGLAKAYGMQSQLTLMEDVLANFPSDDPRSIRLRDAINVRLNTNNDGADVLAARQAIETPSPNNERRADVLLQQERGQFITNAQLHNTSAQLLVDTGASTTALSDAIFEQIDPDEVEFLGLFTVSTAGGKLEAPIYKVKKITLGSRSLFNTSVLILPKENLGHYDGLLGMNVLSQFDLNYDAASETMSMYKK